MSRNPVSYRQQLIKWAKRRETIRALRAGHWSWTEIGRKFSITPQRAQQLGKKSN